MTFNLLSRVSTVTRDIDIGIMSVWSLRRLRPSVRCVPVLYRNSLTHCYSFLSASLYISKRGAYWDRLCRDVVGRWLVGWLVVTRVHCGQTVHPRPSYYGTLIGNPTPGIQWYNFRPPGVTPNRRILLFLSTLRNALLVIQMGFLLWLFLRYRYRLLLSAGLFGSSHLFHYRQQSSH